MRINKLLYSCISLLLINDISSVVGQADEYWRLRQQQNEKFLNAQYNTNNNQQQQSSQQSQLSYDQALQDLQQNVKIGSSLAIKHSFSPPLSLQIPFWNVGASSTIYSDLIRLTPAQQGRYGFVWNTVPNVDMSDWSISIEFKITGQVNMGADGMAFWYTDKPETIGSVYGSTDYWVGLGIMFDTFNNDNIGRNPSITAVYNDGTKKYDFASDGQSQSIGTCAMNYRNTQQPAVAKITYQNKKLTLDIATRRDSNNQPIFNNCFDVDNLELGLDKYFGVTAATGEITDTHDVISFLTTDLSAPSVDLQAVRESYRAVLTQQQHESYSTQGDIPNDQFQSQVLTLLKQIQTEVNLMELSSLSISEWLHKRLDTSNNNNNNANQPAGIPQELKLDTLTQSKIDSTADQLASILRLLQQQNGLSSNSEALNHIKSLISSNQNQFTNLNSQIRQLHAKLNDLQGKLSNNITPSAISSGSSWLQSTLLIIISIASIGSLAMTWRSHKANNRYKLV